MIDNPLIYRKLCNSPKSIVGEVPEKERPLQSADIGIDIVLISWTTLAWGLTDGNCL